VLSFRFYGHYLLNCHSYACKNSYGNIIIYKSTFTIMTTAQIFEDMSDKFNVSTNCTSAISSSKDDMIEMIRMMMMIIIIIIICVHSLP